MNIFLGVAIGAAIAASVAGLATSFARVDHKPEQQHAVADVDQYRVFIYVADQYMKTAPAVSVNTVRTWDELKSTSLTPVGARSGGMPYGWKVIQIPPKEWVACTEMDERSISLISQLAPRPSVSSGGVTTTEPGLVPVYIGLSPGVSHVVMGTETSAPALAALCT